MPIEIFDCTLKKVYVKYFVYQIKSGGGDNTPIKVEVSTFS